MTRPAVITLTGVSKTYQLQAARPRTLKQALLGGSRHALAQQHVALDGLDLVVRAGESVGIIGTNGSGKSTLLKLITGIIRPSSGAIAVDGRISPLLELGAGFHPEFSGRDNAYLNGAILGMGRKEMAARLEAIAEFAEIGEFLDQPVKTYSSGMYMRLAFAVAIHVDPDLLLVDEVLAVGDEAFREKCLAWLAGFRAAGNTLVFVSHDAGAVRAVSDRVVWLDRGRKRLDGDPDEVLAAYLEASARPASPVV
jgi:ABC-type polysaccharide/polyol phosphate transport system ATPase subunit